MIDVRSLTRIPTAVPFWDKFDGAAARSWWSRRTRAGLPDMDDSAGPEPQAGPCLLPDHLLVQKLLRYDQRRWDLVDAARKALACDLPLEALARVPIEHPAVGTPPVHRAMLEVRKGRRDGLSVSSLKRVRHEERRGWQHSPARHEFDEAFDRFVTEWVLPQFGCDILVSPATLRVVLPGGTRPSRPHCDADYRYGEARARTRRTCSHRVAIRVWLRPRRPAQGLTSPLVMRRCL